MLTNALKSLGFGAKAARETADAVQAKYAAGDVSRNEYLAAQGVFYKAEDAFRDAAYDAGVELPSGCGEDILSILEG